MFGQVVAEPVEAVFPGRALPHDPVLGHPQHTRLDVAGAVPGRWVACRTLDGDWGLLSRQIPTTRTKIIYA
jgi:hypothetical protein